MTATHEPERLIQIPVELIDESKLNPRSHFDQKRMEELTASVREHGVLTPLLVRPAKRGSSGRGQLRFELAAGHRRLRAARAAGLATVPAVERAMDDRRFAEVLNLENLQREDLDELDEAEGFRQLRELAGYDVDAIALKLSRSTKYVYDRLKLLDLVDEARALLRAGRITAGHGILLARLAPEVQKSACDPNLSGNQSERGGLWEYEKPDHRGLFGDETPHPLTGGEADLLEARKPKTVRELEAWINAHVRLDKTRLDPVYDPAAHSLFAATEAEEALEVVHITRLHQLPPSARGADRTLCARSWKRADGEEEFDPSAWRRKKTKPCEHAVKGVVVVGPGRGEVFDICTAKKACKVHWKDEQKGAPKSRTSADSRRQSQARWKAQREREDAARDQQEQAWEKAWPTFEATIRQKVGSMDLDATSKCVQQAFRAMGEPLDMSESACDALLHRSKDGFRALVELFALGLARKSGDRWAKPEKYLAQADALLGGNQLRSAFGTALKEVQTSALQSKLRAEKAAKAQKKAPRGAGSKGKSKRAGRARSALPLVLAIAGALLAVALGGCNGPGWARVASTLEVGAGTTDHRADDALGNPIYADSTQVWVSIRPLAFIEPPKEVIVVDRKGGGGK